MTILQNSVVQDFQISLFSSQYTESWAGSRLKDRVQKLQYNIDSTEIREKNQ